MTTTTIPGQQLQLYGLEIRCDMGVGIGGDRWPAAELFCDFVLDDAYNAFFRTLFINRRVIGKHTTSLSSDPSPCHRYTFF